MIQREEWQIGIRIGKDVEIITKVPAVTGGIPTDRAIWLRKVTVAVAVKDSGFPAVTGMVRSKAGSSDNRGTITSDVQMSWINLSTPDGFIQEAGAEDGKQQTVSFLIGMECDRGKTLNEFSNGFLFNGGSFLTFPFGLLDLLLYRRLDVGREVRRCKIPKPVDEVVEGVNAWDIPGLKSAEDSKKL